MTTMMMKILVSSVRDDDYRVDDKRVDESMIV